MSLEAPEAEPWLTVFVRDGDDSIDAARERFAANRSVVVAELRRAKIPLEARMRDTAGRLTTCIEPVRRELALPPAAS
jgi:hypothetical protein